ncbi:uncharacterized protein LOC132181865 [Corylus avellana]|uniref:uncharacterized protein LOC132181865 n=1 Tax=Corylus avellana TaxID=13451 RepID=UPI00286CCCCB|nr:uncharacterized protein LOC132181865 [Corylus avellana]XP_059451084.1 uncharacterized protein LOC132181865 [Corylus avellana]XP_059451088.1 uncharacterized protein LOC132181865 [Corylus avellana]
MDVISDENLLEGSQANDQNSDNVAVMDVSSDDDLPEGSQPQANDPNRASQSTPTDNIEMMDISSDEELSDVSPEVSKSKFSPATVNVAPKRFKVVHTRKVGSSSARREVLEQQLGNTNHPEEPYGGGEVEVNIVGDQRRAGIGRMAEVWNLPEGRKIPILCNDFGQPLDIEGCVYTRFLGSIARTHTILPINFNGWRKVPMTNKEAAWNVILSKNLLPDDGGQYDVIKKWSMKDLEDKWTNWKHNLKNKYFVSPKLQNM